MLCCVGLFGGMAVGQALGGPWTYVAPAVGFGIGLVGDMKFMKGMHGTGHKHETEIRAKEAADPVRGTEADESKQDHRVADAGAKAPISPVAGAALKEGAPPPERLKGVGTARASST